MLWPNYMGAPDKHGVLKLQQPDTPPDFLSLPTGMSTQSIPINKPHDGTRYLGLYITANWNTVPMEQHLWNKALLYTTALRRTPMDHRKAGILYRSCFLPAMTYPLPATWLLDSFFERVHSLSTSVILNKMGCHGHLPRAMVFAPRAMGGIGLCHLQHEMETQQILMLLRHMRAKTPLGSTIEILLCQY